MEALYENAGNLFCSIFLSKAGIYSDVVRERGLEPPRPEGHQPLKLTRLPIPPLARMSD